jgi:hypothetical protein
MLHYVMAIQRYKPESDEVDVLLSDLFFANGIGIDKEEQYVVFAETFGIKLTKYYVAGEKEGTMEYIVNGSPSPACELLQVSTLCIVIVLLSLVYLLWYHTLSHFRRL